MITRALTSQLGGLKKSILLLGPRQVGKSTLLRELNPDLIINLAREKEFLDHASDPALIETLVAGAHSKTVMVDEVQRIPSILNTIQAIIDEKKIRFLISGSSARKLKRGQANLLPGRVLSYSMGGLSAIELNGDLNLSRSLTFGFLPEIFVERDLELAKMILTSYAGTYLKEEIQAELLVRNILGFSRFLTSFAEHSGRILDLSKVSSKAKVSRTGASRFLEILEETLLILKCESLQVTNADTVAHPKYYFFDPGVLNGLLGGFEFTKDRAGLMFEHAVIAQFQNTAAALHIPVKFFYFRTRNGLEIDFVLKIREKYWAIEAKSGNISEQDSKPLEAFKTYFPNITERVIVVPEGPRRRWKNGIQVLSLSDLIHNMFL